MNQDFTVKKKQYLSKKKIPAQAVREKKKFVPAENPPPPSLF